LLRRHVKFSKKVALIGLEQVSEYKFYFNCFSVYQWLGSQFRKNASNSYESSAGEISFSSIKLITMSLKERSLSANIKAVNSHIFSFLIPPPLILLSVSIIPKQPEGILSH